jgi:SAM-dependent methyltransferase
MPPRATSADAAAARQVGAAPGHLPDRACRQADDDPRARRRLLPLSTRLAGVRPHLRGPLNPRRAYARLRRLATDLLFEWRYGVHTSHVVQHEELGLVDKDRVHYVPSGWWSLRRILPRNDVSEDDVFVDLGAGMGRIVLLAAMYDIRRVVGVEISDRLSDMARRNIEAVGHRLCCKQVDIITTDVLDFRIPDDASIIYMYSPFKGEIFRAVVDNIIASVDRSPRRVRIIYRFPEEEQVLLDSGRVRVIRTTRGLRPTKKWARALTVRMYEVVPLRRSVE